MGVSIDTEQQYIKQKEIPVKESYSNFLHIEIIGHLSNIFGFNCYI